MRFLLLIFFFLWSLPNSWGQIAVTSPVTQHWPTVFTTEFEDINRSIWIDEREIIIITDIPGGKEIESLKVQSFERTKTDIIFHCTTRNGNESVTVIIPYQDRIEIIDVYRISQKSEEEIQLRFHLD